MARRHRRFQSAAVFAAMSAAAMAQSPRRAIADMPGTPKSPKSIDRSKDDDLKPRIALPTVPGDYKLKFKTRIGDRAVELAYLLHLPPDYATNPGKKHPMLVFFHGIGERGTDLGGVLALGPMPMINSSPTFAASCPFIVLCPQCTPDVTWDTDYVYKAAAQLVAQTIRNTRTDPDRVYATGLSMGGLGAWCAAEDSPDLFAAIAPLSAMAWHPEEAGKKLKYVWVWAISGVNDQPRFIDGCQAMDAALSHDPLPDRFTYMVDRGHDAWWPPFQSMGFYEWLLAHRRLTPAQRKKLDAQTAPAVVQPMQTTHGHYLLNCPVMVGNQPFHMDYVLYLPKGYKPHAHPYPAMLFLCEQDDIGPDYHDLCVHGPDLELERKPALENNFPFVVISPRAPIDCDWNRPGMTKALLTLLDHVGQGINIDVNRISVTGVNSGADGAWKLACEAPGRFSAVAPVVMAGQFNPPGDRANLVKELPGRVFLKPSDSASTARVENLIKNSKLDWRIVKLPATASAITDIPAYSDHPFLTWLAGQHRAPGQLSATSARSGASAKY